MSDTDSDTASSVGSLIEDASEPDTTTFKCLFCDKPWGNVPEMFTHCESEHKFNVKAAIQEIGSKLEEIGVIKLVNYLRLEAQKGTDPSALTVTPENLADDKYLVPTLEDDPLLFELGDFMPDSNEQVRDYEEYEAVLSKNLPEDVSKIDVSGERDERYFDSYKGNGIHREMIEDRVRTESYRDFIEKYAHLIKDKVVLDVGCGTSILSLFCARAGAKKVFAIDNSDIALRAREIVKKNGYDNVVEVIQGRIEDFHLQQKIGKGNVDIIVSEWMGYGLLFEGMLDSVLKARDIYLKPDGLMVPSHCTLRVAPISDKTWISESTGENFWKDVYGFDFSTMIPGGLLNDREIGVFDVPPKSISGSASTFYELDLARITVPELDFTAPYSTTLDRDVESLDAFAIWFDTFFLPHGSKPDLSQADALKWSANGAEGVAMATGPFGTATHWHQAVLLLDDKDRKTSLKQGTTLKGQITYKKRRRDVRGIDVDVSWAAEGVEGKVSRPMG
ncbi:S-adenosyl-L-methionine-dependent methyltransferase [Aaosphaeria arxii CBS 175.79]|uniref:type I protein arginine methyltransferase n=1 Tax=Aaosphaeria arxii CBS 175.79 TaxID=1450172 RepID=A0A6A5Y705_9PLEO|nr:S-adenosyl-L-methionine-dependent methyltransferase [Aaosphaeria arxii CBS 175.79]KAF2021003.1 S-adenosyl-L-methionine-dependent methyltransferase [Aaosphaeria arxii CBS 175.79]